MTDKKKTVGKEVKKQAVVKAAKKIIKKEVVKKEATPVVSKTKTFVKSRYGTKHFKNEVAYGIYSHLMMQVNEVFEKQPGHMGFDKFNLDNFVSAPAHGSLHNSKEYIKCNATDSETINQWAQHMAVIIADSLRVALTREIFKVDSLKG